MKSKRSTHRCSLGLNCFGNFVNWTGEHDRELCPSLRGVGGCNHFNVVICAHTIIKDGYMDMCVCVCVCVYSSLSLFLLFLKPFVHYACIPCLLYSVSLVPDEGGREEEGEGERGREGEKGEGRKRG